MDSFNGYLYHKSVLLGKSLWVSVSALFFTLFGLFNRLFFNFRVHADEISQEFDHVKSESEFEQPKLDYSSIPFRVHETEISQEFDHMKSESEFEQPELDYDELGDIKSIKTEVQTNFERLKPKSIDVEETEDDEEESPKFVFKFKFPSFEEFSRSNAIENLESIPPISNSRKCEFKCGDYVSNFSEKPDETSFAAEELHTDSENGSRSNQEIMDDDVLSEKDFVRQNSEEENVHEPEPDKIEVKKFSKEFEQTVYEQENRPSDKSYAGKAIPESDSGSDSDISSNGSSFISHFVGSINDGLFSDEDFEEEFEIDINGDNAESTQKEVNSEDIKFQNLSPENENDEEDSDILEELEKLEESQVNTSSNIQIPEPDNHNGSEKPSLGNSSNPSGPSDSNDQNGLETLWEHQDLIEQLKMELKKMKATGLPTILEESESPKLMDDLKPWKIDEKFQHEDTMGELHKFYKSYRERMRKFDILNYQKMYSIGFLQSKDPLKAISSSKVPSSTMSSLPSLLSQNLLLAKRRKSESDPMKKFIRELHSDLEAVYVGQLCLSWEILHWQYEKSLELWESDPYGIRKFNEVAGEFQQFQVLVQRFIENEPFDGPRVQNYVKNRCILRNILQVPVIREDNVKDKRKARTKGRDDYAITSDVLVELMEESIRIFWRFVRADKDTHISVYKGRKRTQIEPQDSLDLELLAEVRASLQKKEKKLKDILRAGNCLLRKFQKQEDGSDQVLYFFSQVDMKLVARVLNMSKLTTDQLLWCQSKLNKINFVSRKKIHVEPSFLLFPC